MLHLLKDGKDHFFRCVKAFCNSDRIFPPISAGIQGASNEIGKTCFKRREGKATNLVIQKGFQGHFKGVGIFHRA